MIYSLLALIAFCAASAVAQQNTVVVIQQNNTAPAAGAAAPGMMMRPVVNNVEVTCDPDQMRVIIATEGPFSGKVYPKGFFKKDECVQTFNNQPTPFIVNMTFAQVQQCGMVMTDQDQQTAFTSVIVIQPHNKLVTMMAKAYQVRCTYDYRGSRLTENGFTGLVTDGLNVSMLGTVWEEGPGLALRLLEGGIGQADGTAAPPTAQMEIYFADRSRVAERVNLGDLLEMRISLPVKNARDVFGIYVRGCTVADGMGMDNHRLLNENGCPVDPMVFPHFSYTEQQSTAIALFKAHKFPYTSEVQYVCYVDFCLKLNNGCKDFQDRAQLLEAGVCPSGLPRESRILSAVVRGNNDALRAVSNDQEATIPVHQATAGGATIGTNNNGQPATLIINGQTINTANLPPGRITIQVPGNQANGVTVVQPGQLQQQNTVVATPTVAAAPQPAAAGGAVNADDLALIRQLQAEREAQRQRDQAQLLQQLADLRRSQLASSATPASVAVEGSTLASGGNGVTVVVAQPQGAPQRFDNVNSIGFQRNPSGTGTTVRETNLPADQQRTKRSLERTKRQAPVSDESVNRAQPEPVQIRRALYVLDTDGLTGPPSNETRRAGILLGSTRDLSFEPHLPMACTGMENATYLFVIIIVLGGALLLTIAVLVFVLIRMAMRTKKY